jgi:hypothetical protein
MAMVNGYFFFVNGAVVGLGGSDLPEVRCLIRSTRLFTRSSFGVNAGGVNTGGELLAILIPRVLSR